VDGAVIVEASDGCVLGSSTQSAAASSLLEEEGREKGYLEFWLHGGGRGEGGAQCLSLIPRSFVVE
jgi:hypothetical protein